MQFSRKLWGYRQDQVDNYINKMNVEYEKKAQSLQLEINNMMKVNEQLKDEISSLQAELIKYQKAEKAVAEAFIQAQLKAITIEEDARIVVAEMENEVLQKMESKKRELDELQSLYSQAKTEFEEIIVKYRLLIEPS